MSDGTSRSGRREPPPFRRVTLLGRTQVSPHMVEIVLAGPELAGLVVAEPAASVRLLVPGPGHDELVIPKWNGNEFLLEDGTRPVIRTFTPHRYDPQAGELRLSIVIHLEGAASTWAGSAPLGAPAAVSGTGRGYTINPEASAFVLMGDETAIPAIAQLLETIPESTEVEVDIEVRAPDAEFPMPYHPGATVRWHVPGSGGEPGDTLVAAARRVEPRPGLHIWCAGEAAAMHLIRGVVFKEKGLSRSQATIRGYWKKR